MFAGTYHMNIHVMRDMNHVNASVQCVGGIQGWCIERGSWFRPRASWLRVARGSSGFAPINEMNLGLYLAGRPRSKFITPDTIPTQQTKHVYISGRESDTLCRKEIFGGPPSGYHQRQTNDRPSTPTPPPHRITSPLTRTAPSISLALGNNHLPSPMFL